MHRPILPLCHIAMTNPDAGARDVARSRSKLSTGDQIGQDEGVAAKALARDWVTARGIAHRPTPDDLAGVDLVAALPGAVPALARTLLRWQDQPVVLYTYRSRKALTLVKLSSAALASYAIGWPSL